LRNGNRFLCYEKEGNEGDPDPGFELKKELLVLSKKVGILGPNSVNFLTFSSSINLNGFLPDIKLDYKLKLCY